MSALTAGRMARVAVAALLAAAAQLALADSPSAVLEPDAFRESINEERLRELGYDPEKYDLELPLGRRLTVQRNYLRAGSAGTFSTGLTERGTDLLRYRLNAAGTIELTQDEARAELHGVDLSRSRRRTATLIQGFGSGTTAGTFSLLHSDTYASETPIGFSRSRSDGARLSLGFGKALGLTTAIEDSSSLTHLATRTRKFDVALARPGSDDPALAEFHESTSWVGGAAADFRQMALRTPKIELGSVAALGASHSETDSSVTGTDTVNAVSLTATPTKALTLTAGHADANRELTADTDVTTVGSQIRVLPDTTISATYTGTETQDAGMATQRTLAVARAPEDGQGLGVEASYTEVGATSAEIEPTIDVKLSYNTASEWAFHGQYRDAHERQSPELVAGVKVPLLGATLGLDYNEYTFDPEVNAVRLTRAYGADVSRPIVWGLSGTVGYRRTDSLADPTIAERVCLGLGGQNRLLGQVYLQYETGELHTPAGRLPDGSSIALSLTRGLGLGDVAISAKRTMPPGPSGSVAPEHQVQVDLKAYW